MRKLEDLKTDLLANKVDKFYVFFGEDVGIRKHYIDKISTYFQQKFTADTWYDIKPIVTSKSLFTIKQLLLVFNDEDFASQKSDDVKKFIDRLNYDFTCIFIYDNPEFDKTNLFKNFEDYCTEFQAVQPNIAKEFVESELTSLNDDDEDELAYNCENLYSNILLEADKIKNYQNYTGISQQGAYETLRNKNQLLYKTRAFSSNEFMNSVLQGNYTNIAYWCEIAMQEENQDTFFKYLIAMFNDFLIAGLCKKYGKFDGSSRAYNYKLSWGRAKTIRDLNLIFDDKYYFDCAYMVAEMDSLVKKGRLERNKLVDYFLTKVI